jgi:hypothetical protein
MDSREKMEVPEVTRNYTAQMFSIQAKIDPGMGKKHAIRIALPRRWQNSV